MFLFLSGMRSTSGQALFLPSMPPPRGAASPCHRASSEWDFLVPDLLGVTVVDAVYVFLFLFAAVFPGGISAIVDVNAPSAGLRSLLPLASRSFQSVLLYL